VVTADVPSNAVVGGIPAKLIRMRTAPKTFRWAD
jgi:acetyltransferase-like isoleucine patch superfamily enzyme